MKNEGKKKNKLLAVYAIIGVIVVACVAFVGLNFDKFGKIYTLADYDSKEFIGNISEYVKLSIDVESTEIEVLTTNSEQIKISYYNMDKDYYTISTVAGEIKMTNTNELESDFFGAIFGYSIPKKKVTIELPKTANLDMDYKLKYGDATFYELNMDKQLKINTDSASVKLQNVTSSKLDIQAKYGDVELNDIKVDTSFKCDTDSVTVKFTEINSNNVNMTAKHGSITGSFVGNSNDYTVTSNIKDGGNNLSDFKGTGSKSINIEADSATANISFTE